MFLVERNGSNPFSLSAQENTLLSGQIVFGWKMLVVVSVDIGVSHTVSRTDVLLFSCIEDVYIKTVSAVSLLYIQDSISVSMNQNDDLKEAKTGT